MSPEGGQESAPGRVAPPSSGPGRPRYFDARRDRRKSQTAPTSSTAPATTQGTSTPDDGAGAGGSGSNGAWASDGVITCITRIGNPIHNTRAKLSLRDISPPRCSKVWLPILEASEQKSRDSTPAKIAMSICELLFSSGLLVGWRTAAVGAVYDRPCCVVQRSARRKSAGTLCVLRACADPLILSPFA
jgi:hypothetical protein